MAGTPRAVAIQDAKTNNAKHEHPEPPMAFGRHRSQRCAGGAALGEVHGVELAHSFAPVIYHGVRTRLSRIGHSQIDTRGRSGGCGEPVDNYSLRLSNTAFGGECLRGAQRLPQTRSGAPRKLCRTRNSEAADNS